MTVYVGEIRFWTVAWGYSCHMMTDGPIEELHEMAEMIGLNRQWFQDRPLHPHYDLRSSKRRLAIQKGAVEISDKEMVYRCSKLFRKDV